MLEGTNLIQRTNMFNQIINSLLWIEINFDDEDKTMILLYSSSFVQPLGDHVEVG